MAAINRVTVLLHFSAVSRCRLPTSADNVTLLTFADERRVAVRRAPLSIDISCPPGPQQQTRHSGMQLSINGTDRQTDKQTYRRTPYHTDPAGQCQQAAVFAGSNRATKVVIGTETARSETLGVDG